MLVPCKTSRELTVSVADTGQSRILIVFRFVCSWKFGVRYALQEENLFAVTV